MKSLKLVGFIALMLVGFNVSAQNTNDNSIIGKARGAASDCLNNYLSQGISVEESVETTGICFVEGTMKTVTFFTTVRCHQEPCPKPASVVVAKVVLDCENNVVSVTCF